MATGKKSFVLYADYIHTVGKLTDVQAGKLLKHILKYVNDEDPVMSNKIVELVFEPIKQQLKRDLSEWETTKEHNSDSGNMGNLKRWNQDLYEKVRTNKMSLQEALVIAKGRKASPPDTTLSPPVAKIAVTVNDNVTVNDTDNVIKEKEEKLFSSEYQKWHEENCMALKIEMPVMKKMLADFIAIEKAKQKFAGKPIGEVQSHFVSWARLELEKITKKNGNHKGNSVPPRYTAGKQDYSKTSF